MRFAICDLRFIGRLAWVALLCLSSVATRAAATTDFVSDHPDLIVSSTQDWGVLGFDTAAHQADKHGQPLQIGDKTYSKGVGHHANGAITILLDGQYAALDAEVGLQPCAGGSVIFRVFVDGQPGFDSGVLRSGDAPKPVHVEVAGAQELRLEASDAGDGINCDMANWADARLTPATGVAPTRPAEHAVDIARFARVVTWDPNRTDGARASRIEEFRAEDLFLETALVPKADGTYTVPVSTNGLVCVGLQWLNRRALRELALDFANAAQVPGTNGVRVEGWFGESAWQGNWKPLAGEMERDGNRLVFRLATKAGVMQTQKIRWVLPSSPSPIVLRRLTAFTRSRWATANIFAQIEKPPRGARGEVNVCNGELVDPSAIGDRRLAIEWSLAKPIHLSVCYSRPSSFKSDPTVLQFRLPTGAFGVAIEDVLSNDCVYLPDHGLFVARQPLRTTLSDYKRTVAGRKTISQQVRELPDQTFAQAMAKTHHDTQREGPVMLSLACDNTKFVVERDGTVRFQTTTNVGSDWFASAGELRPQFGNGKPDKLTRALDGGWLPIALITVEKDGLVWQQRSFVAPCDEAGANATRLNRRSVCVVEFSVTNTLARPADAALALNFLLNTRQKKPASLTRCVRGYFILDEQGPFARALTDAAAPLAAAASDASLQIKGSLPPHGSASFAVQLPAQRTDLLTLPDAARLRAETEAYWNAVLAPAMQIETPDALLNNVIRSSQVRCLIAARNEADGARIAPWIAAMSYGPLESEAHSVIRGMDFLGHAEFARRGLDFFIHRYNTNGLLTTGYTTFGTGWHLWTLGEHYQLTRDREWLRQVAPEIARVGDWIIRQTEKTQPTVAANLGRLPRPAGEHRDDAVTPVRSADFQSAVSRLSKLHGARQFEAPWNVGSPSRLEIGETAGWKPALRARLVDRQKGLSPTVGVRRLASPTTPEFGLLPPGVLADWNSFAYHYTMNAYYYAALRELGTALGDLAKPEGRKPKPERSPKPEARRGIEDASLRTSELGLPSDFGFRSSDFTAAAAGLRANILRAYRWTQSRSPALPLRNGTWIPHYPSQVHSPGKLGDFFPGQDAGRSWCYDVEIGAHQLVPTGVLDPRSREVERMMDHMEDVQFLADGWFDYSATMNHADWFNLGGFSKVQPYYTRNCEVYALRDDVKPFIRSYFNSLASLLNPEVLTFWEHFHHSGAWDKTHETGYFLHQTRTMLVTERGDELWLAPFITSNWLKDGQRTSVENAPTHFGPVSYRITSHVAQGHIVATIEPPTRSAPKAIVLRLRHPDGKRVRSVTVNGRRHLDFDTATEMIRLQPLAGPMAVRVAYR